MQWDDNGISVFFFPRNAIPDDITAKQPLPDTWGQPMAFWPTSTCSSFQFFNTHSLIFDTTLWYVFVSPLAGCWSVSHAKFDYGSGDWASGVWGSSGITGQEQSCAQRTGFSTCEAFVQQTGSAFQDACTSSLFLSSPIFAHSIVTQIGKSATSKYTSRHHNRYQPSSVL